MPRGRVRRRAAGRGSGWTTARRRAPAKVDDTEEFLRQAISTSAHLGREGKTVKKRRVGGRLVVLEPDADTHAGDASTEPAQKHSGDHSDGAAESSRIQLETVDAESSTAPPAATSSSPAQAHAQQIAYATSDESDSDVDFEDVDLDVNPFDPAHSSQPPSPKEPEELNIVLGANDEKSTPSARRKGVTAEERKLRLDLHKMHVLCLLMHAATRNHWCNDSEVQSQLRKVLSTKTINYLVDDESQSQFQRGRSFKEGMEAAVDEFRKRFRVSARGMARSYWASSSDEIADIEVPDDIDLPMEKPDFRDAAAQLRGSRDVGAQLFCALLRSIGMDVRLTCSLQALPISSTGKSAPTPTRTATASIGHVETRMAIDGSSDADSDTSPRSRGKQAASRVNRKGTPLKSHAVAARPGRAKKRGAPESKFPIYWVEVFEPAYQRWTPVDPLVTGTIAKPMKLEPPASDAQNNMAYVVGFEDDGFMRDVTRRYVKAYNAKTRKLRVESTTEGPRWWKRMLRLYRRPERLDRDQVEDATFAKNEASEEMPRNVADFKDHPYYALKRHLRKNEVIHPERAVGKVFTGRLTNDRNQEAESVFRRRDVKIVKSADSWYRLGREVKGDEEPLKWAQPRRSKSRLPDDEPEEEATGAPMFSFQQTDLYVPPPVVRGRVPKNRFKNLDIYCASMIPPGGVHVVHPSTSAAARLLGIDYADAVTGFEFRGRVGTAVVRGAVVAVPFVQAVVDVIHGLAYEKAAEIADKRSELALRAWVHLLKALRIRERVQSYAVEGEEEEEEGSEYTGDEERDDSDEDNDREDENGSETANSEPAEDVAEDILPDFATFLAAQPPVQITCSTAVAPEPSMVSRARREDQSNRDQPVTLRSSRRVHEDETEGGFVPEPQDAGGGFLPDSPHGATDTQRAGGFLTDETDAAEGGGFLTEEAETGNGTDLGGGFLPEAHDENHDEHESKQLEHEVAPVKQEGFLPDASEANDYNDGNPSMDIDEAEPAHEQRDTLAEVKADGEQADATQTNDQSKRKPDPAGNNEKPDGGVEAQDISSPGSLLSHDPEDEDAEPEWLMDVG